MPVFGRQFLKKEIRVKSRNKSSSGESDAEVDLWLSSITDSSKNASNKSYTVRS